MTCARPSSIVSCSPSGTCVVAPLGGIRQLVQRGRARPLGPLDLRDVATSFPSGARKNSWSDIGSAAVVVATVVVGGGEDVDEVCSALVFPPPQPAATSADRDDQQRCFIRWEFLSCDPEPCAPRSTHSRC